MDFNLNSVTGVPYTHNYVNKFFMNPVVLLVLVGIVIVYFIIFASSGVSKGSPTGPPTSGESEVKYLEIMLWAIFVLLILLNGMSYLFNFDVTASLTNLFSQEPNIDVLVNNRNNRNNRKHVTGSEEEEYAEKDLTSDNYINGDDLDGSPVPEITAGKQVYHIPGNKYTYEDAKAICSAYGSRIANIEDLQKSYKDGADWCSFGWSDDQLALYPTQLEKWKRLQTIKGHKHDCGRPGINGGYIANKNVRFGVNCYGNKPEITSEEAKLMADAPIYPVTQKEIDFNKRVNYWKTQIPNILVAPFNNENWSNV